jgi:hypothetical protein
MLKATKYQELMPDPFDADAWDRQIEDDICAGRLDDLAMEALEEHRAGGSREIPLDEIQSKTISLYLHP